MAVIGECYACAVNIVMMASMRKPFGPVALKRLEKSSDWQR